MSPVAKDGAEREPRGYQHFFVLLLRPVRNYSIRQLCERSSKYTEAAAPHAAMRESATTSSPTASITAPPVRRGFTKETSVIEPLLDPVGISFLHGYELMLAARGCTNMCSWLRPLSLSLSFALSRGPGTNQAKFPAGLEEKERKYCPNCGLSSAVQ